MYARWYALMDSDVLHFRDVRVRLPRSLTLDNPTQPPGSILRQLTPLLNNQNTRSSNKTLLPSCSCTAHVNAVVANYIMLWLIDGL